MVDLHSHILPGIDDGARDLADALAMARQAEDDGIQIVCATPHIRHDHDVRIAELADRSAELTVEIARLGMSVRIAPAAEVAETALDGLDDSELAACAYGGAGGWILLEPAPGPLGDSLLGRVRGLRDRGFRVLIAHPERHLSEDLKDRLAGLIAAGALVQATAAYFEDERTRPGMLELAGAGLVHVLGSDSHSARGGRRLALSGALEALWEVDLLRAHIDWIAHEAPRAILGGHAATPPFRVRA